MPRATRKSPALKMKRAVYRRLLMYGLSHHEFGAILFGRCGVVTEAIRIRNVDPLKYNYFEWDKYQRASEIRQAKERGLALMAECHSHPGVNHSERPSSLDQTYFDRSVPHLIIRSHGALVSCWNLKSLEVIELRIVP